MTTDEQRAYKRQWAKAHPQIRDRKRDSEVMRAWRNGITVAEMLQFFKDHDYRCDICRKPWNPEKHGGGLTLDHDHTCCPSQAPRVPVADRGARLCGKCLRGLLCVACNAALGQLAESPERFQSAMDYLARTTK